MDRSDPSKPIDPGLAAAGTGRYRVLSELGRGGIGVVFRAQDLSIDRTVALKRLRADRVGDPRLGALFEREFHTLAHLEHPAIVEVHDYGVDARGPYYTMELLEGDSLGQSAPIPFGTLAAQLRSVASALGLLHFRRLVHRDVSPRNVHIDEAERAKLIDFGALASFGAGAEIVGTPPTIAPEVVSGAALDQRTDVFALGATAYYALTGRHAYRARSLEDLPAVWRIAPSPPSAFEPSVPAAMDELILAMLSPDPLGRPTSMAEVIERVVALADLPAEPEGETMAGHLLNPPLVGRERELGRLRQRLSRASGGRGSALRLVAEEGMGKSRLMGELVLEAQLAGAVVARVAATHASAPWSLSQDLVRALLESSPTTGPRALGEGSAVLVAAFPQLVRHLGPSAAPAALRPAGAERRSQLTALLTDFIARLTDERTVVLVVDDAHRADEESLVFLGSLAVEARNRRLLLLFGERAGPLVASRALAGIDRVAAALELRPLTVEQLERWVELLFGASDHGVRLAHGLHRRTGGNPMHCMELLRGMMDRGTVRYQAGSWILPTQLSADDLAADYDQALAARLARLGEGARSFAEIVAIHGRPIGVEGVLRLRGAMDESAAFSALDELVREGILASTGSAYSFVQEATRDAIVHALPRARAEELHLRIGRFLLERSEGVPARTLDAGLHLLEGGEDLEAVTLLEDASAELTIRGEALVHVAPALERALEVRLDIGRPPEHCIRILSPLMGLAYVHDPTIAARHASMAIDAIYRVTGLALAGRLAPYLGRRIGLLVAYGYGVLRHFLTPRDRRARDLTELFAGLWGAAASCVATGAVAQNVELSQKVMRGLWPLSVLKPESLFGFMYVHVDAGRHFASGDDARAARAFSASRSKLEDPRQLRGLREGLRVQFEAAVYTGLGTLASFRAGDEALAFADRLEALPIAHVRVAAHSVRALYRAGRGEMELAARHRAKHEAASLDLGSVWRSDVTFARHLSIFHFLCRDLVALKRTVSQLEGIAERIPSMAYVHRTVRASYLLLRGDVVDAVEILAEAVRERGPKTHARWGPVRMQLAEGLNDLGRHEEAEAVCREALSHLEAEDRRYVLRYQGIERALSLAEAGLGRMDEAIARLDALLAEPREGDNPLVLGLLHRDRAELARRVGDEEAWARHARAMKACFRPTRNPALVAQVERTEESGAALEGSPKVVPPVDATQETSREARGLHARLERARGGAERARVLLEELLRATGAARGHLFVVPAGGGRLLPVASAGESGSAERFEVRLSVAVDAEADQVRFAALSSSHAQEAGSSAHEEADAPTALPDETGSEPFYPLIFAQADGGERRIVAAAALLPGGDRFMPPKDALIRVVARQLDSAGALSKEITESEPAAFSSGTGRALLDRE